jgi:predicted ATPase
MATKKSAFRLIVEYLLRVAARGPAVLVWEDVQWADPSTIELLGQFFERSKEAAILTIATTRPEGEAPWRERPDVTLVTLPRMARGEIEALVLEVSGGKELPPEVLRELAAKTDGVPLFVEETTKAVLEGGLLREEAGRFVLSAALPALGIPITLKDSLMARLDRLPGVKRVAQLAAAIGRHFSGELLAAIAGLPATDLARALDRLVGAGLVVPPPDPDGAYAFRHALLRDIAYESMLHASKRTIHERIAEALETEFAELGAAQPELLAHHLANAGFAERAALRYRDAGRRAATRSDNAEAVAHLSAGMALVESLPDGRARDEQELALQVLRAGALRATKGIAHPSTGEAYERARWLCHRLLDDAQIVPTLNGLYSFHLVRAEYARAGEVANELLTLAERQAEATNAMIGHRAVGAVLLHVGKLREAREHLERALAMYEPRLHGALAFTHGTDPAVITSSFLSLAMWAMGDRARAHAVQEEALAIAERMEHVHSMAQALTFRCMLLTLEGDAARVVTHAERLLDLSTRHWLGLMGASARFWGAAARRPRTRATVDEMRRAADGWWATGALGYRPMLEAVTAEALLDLGDAEVALEWATRAERHCAESEERWIEPEVLRIEARVLGALGRGDEAQRCVARARAMIEEQGARGWQAKLPPG